jgi:hypothetical protein
MAEIWKPVPSRPGYLASSLGRILAPPSYAPLPNGGYRLYAPDPVYGNAPGGKQHLYLRTKGGQSVTVHRAVCEAFNGPPPFEGAVCMHLDEDAANNRPENLKWGTQKENLNAPGFKAYCRSRTGENSPRAKWAANRNQEEAA